MRGGVYVSAGFGRPIGHASLQWLKSLGVSGVRTDIPWAAPLQYRERLIAELAEVGLGGILIIGSNMEYCNGPIMLERSLFWLAAIRRANSFSK
jgi:hypothetical protein